MVLQDTPANHTVMDAVVGGVLVATQLGTVLLSHLKGKRGQKAQSDGMDKKLSTLGSDLRTAINVRCDSLDNDVRAATAEITKVKGYVVGDEGQNGLRGDIRTLKLDVQALKDARPDRRRRR